jgi:hypothetical protein
MRAFRVLLFATAVAGVAVVVPPTLPSDARVTPHPTGHWTGVLAAKRLVGGVVGGGCVASKAGDACAATASIFPSAPRNVNEGKMGVQGGTFDNPYCVGGIARPAPAPGFLCIYPNPAESVNVALTSEGLVNAEPHPIYDGRRGFKIVWTAQAPGSTQFYAVWAYRAP